MLSGIGINKSFNSKYVLKDVNVDLKPGTITTLIGPSGSGKSTLLRSLALLEPPEVGTIIVDEVSYEFPSNGHNKPNPPWPEVTIVFQQLFLWPHLTLRDNILLPLRARGGQCKGLVNELIEALRIESFVDRYPNEVSLGQRQRAAIVRALALRPKYLLLDEITSALDVEYVSLLLDHLKRVKDEGIGILLVTHLIGFARASADQVLFMDAGKIVEAGDSEILSKPKTERLAQFLSLVIAAR
jgi:ABC-type polar amino acid transport system ATPase subunit